MGKKYKNLYSQITSDNSLQKAFIRASTGKRQSHGYLVFNEYAQKNLLTLQERLIDESWKPSPLRKFYVYEPKERLIGAPTFSDRIVHHALCAVIEPIFDKTFLPYSFACRDNKGTHAGVIYLQSLLRKNNYKYYLKTDFSKYFPSIDLEILHKEFDKKITCKQTKVLFSKIVPQTGKGVPIGALTSQLSANIYGNILDQYLHHQLKVKFVRYMDDVVILGNNINELRQIKEKLEIFAQEKMLLTLSKWNINKTKNGINFLGYRIWATHKLIRKSSVYRAKRKIKFSLRNQDFEYLLSFIGSWKGHVDLANSHNLKIWLQNQHDLVKNLAIAKVKKRKTRQTLFTELF